MRKRILFIPLILFFLYSCSQLAVKTTTTRNYTSIITSTNTIKPSLIPTIIQTSTLTIIPSQTTSPTTTNIPVPKYYGGVEAPSLEAYTQLTSEQIYLVGAKILNDPDSLDSVKPYYASVGGTSLFKGESISCLYGVSCIGEASVRLVNPHGGPDEWIQIWKFIGPDKKKAITYFYLGGSRNDTTIRSEAYRKHNRIKEMSTGDNVDMIIASTITSDSYKDIANPLAWDMTNGASEEDKAAHKEFVKTGIIPVRFGKTVVWLWVISASK